MASNAVSETGHRNTVTAEAVGENAPRTAAWLDLDEDIQRFTDSGEKTPLWMEAGGSSGEHTPTEDTLSGTGWM